MKTLKFWLIGGLVVGLIGSQAAAQVTDMPYRPFYWIVGTVPDSGGVKADGHTVVFYKDAATAATNNVQATIAGNRFMLNAFYLYPLELKVGETYKLAIVKGPDGFGADPIDVTITGKGFEEVAGSGKVDSTDLAAVGAAISLDANKIIEDLKAAGYLTASGSLTDKFDGNLASFQLPGYTEEQLKAIFDVLNKSKFGLQLEPNKGIAQPGAPQLEPAPTIKIWFGNRLYQKGLVAKGEKFVISARPEIKIEVSIPEPFSLSPNLGEYGIILDQGTPAAKTLTLAAQNLAQAVKAQADVIRTMSLKYAISETETLPEGSHTLSISAKSAGSAGVASVVTEAVTVEVLGGPLRMVGTPITYPSPFSISKQGTVYMQYTLSANANIEIYLVSVGGERIKRFSLSSGAEGGSAGINKVAWDGRSDQGYLAGNAIYVGTILARDEGRLLGKFKLTIVD